MPKITVRKRYLLITLTLVMFMTTFVFIGERQNKSVRQERVLVTINTTELMTLDYDVLKGYIGTLYAANKFDVNAKVAGRVVELPVALDRRKVVASGEQRHRHDAQQGRGPERPIAPAGILEVFCEIVLQGFELAFLQGQVPLRTVHIEGLAVGRRHVHARKDAAGIAIERLQPKLLRPAVLLVVVHPVAAESLGQAARPPPGGFVASAFELLYIRERFSQNGTVSILQLPVPGQGAHGQGQRARGEVGHARFAQHQKAAVHRHQVEALGALLGGPANPLLPVGQLQRGASPVQQGHPTPLVFHSLKQCAACAQIPQIVLLVQQLSRSFILVGFENANR